MKCKQCGHEQADGMRFCTRCGTKIALDAPDIVAHETGNEFRVKFERQEQWGAKANTFVIKVDGAEKCRLKHGESKEVRMPKGKHQIEISLYMCKAKKFTLDVDRDRHIQCSYSTSKAIMLNPLLFSPIVAKGENGVEW